MAAVLIYIKSQTLLPREQVAVPDDVIRIRPTDHLMPYDRIKAVVGLLRDKEEEQSAIWQRSALTAPLPDQDLDLVEVSLFDLAESFFAMMKRKQAETTKVLKTKEISVADKTKRNRGDPAHAGLHRFPRIPGRPGDSRGGAGRLLLPARAD